MPPDEPTVAYRTDDYIHEAPDSIDLAIRVFRPTAAEQPLPTLLQRTPYGRPETNFRTSISNLSCRQITNSFGEKRNTVGTNSVKSIVM